MKIKVKDKEYSFDGYVNPINSVQKLAEEIYQRGRADAIEECARTIEISKTLFENHQTETIMSTKDKCIAMIRNLKEQNNEN